MHWLLICFDYGKTISFVQGQGQACQVNSTEFLMFVRVSLSYKGKMLASLKLTFTCFSRIQFVGFLNLPIIDTLQFMVSVLSIFSRALLHLPLARYSEASKIIITYSRTWGCSRRSVSRSKGFGSV